MRVEKINIKNRKASFNYHVEIKLDCGMVLKGSEVKSIRSNNMSMGDAYVRMDEGELWVHNMHIGLYKNAGFNAHTDPLRKRKLLANKYELKRIEQKAKTKGYTMFPLRLYENDKGVFKLEIGLGQGKKLYDKRDDLKQKDIKKQIKQHLN